MKLLIKKLLVFFFSLIKDYQVHIRFALRAQIYYILRDHRGRDRIVVGFTTTYATNAYHQRCEFESRSNEMYLLQHYLIKLVSDLRQVGWFSPVSAHNKTECHDITEI